MLDGSTKGLHALARMECDLVFNLAESFAGNDTADYCIAAYLELIEKRITGAGSHGLISRRTKRVAKKILEFHGIHTPVFARSFRGRLDFSHDLEFPVIVKPAREDGSIGIEFNAVVSSIRELMERIDWLHANFDSPVLIEEYVEGREMYVGVLGNDNPLALPVVELDLSKLPAGTPRIAGAEVKWGKGTARIQGHEVGDRGRSPEETIALLQTTAVARVPGARAPRLRSYRHAAAARRPRCRHRGEPQSLARVQGGIRARGAKSRAHLHATHRRDRRPRAGAVRALRPAYRFHLPSARHRYSVTSSPRALTKRSICPPATPGPC